MHAPPALINGVPTVRRASQMPRLPMQSDGDANFDKSPVHRWLYSTDRGHTARVATSLARRTR